MAGTLTVQNLQGPSSGANANKIIVPSGQTIDASAGTLVPASGQIVQEQVYTNGVRATHSSSVWVILFPSQTFTKKYDASTTKLVLQAQVMVRGSWSYANAPSINVDGTEYYGYGVMTDTAINGDSSVAANKATQFIAPITGLASGSRSISLKLRNYNNSAYQQFVTVNPTSTDDPRYPPTNYGTMIVKEVML